MFTTYGFPVELTTELAVEKGVEVDLSELDTLISMHKEKSKSGSEQKFKGGLADNSKRVVQYHTLTHLLLAGLRKYLGDQVHQAGSNITGERLRFDFTYNEKVQPRIINGLHSQTLLQKKLFQAALVKRMKKKPILAVPSS